MPSCKVNILLLAVTLLHGSVHAAGTDVPLRFNPFVRPDDVIGGAGSAAAVGDASMELRGVMLAGERSLANIGGKIVGIGQDINGYRVIAVNENMVVLDRDGMRKEIGVKTQTGAGNDEQAGGNW